MRLLFATSANQGHFGPLVPLALAAVGAGHQVRVAAPARFAETVRRAGLAHLAFPDAPRELIGPVMGRLPRLPFEEADAVVVREVFARIDAQAALPTLLAEFEDWRPDVVVREPAEFGSLAVAVRAGVPHAQVAIGMMETIRGWAALVAEPLAELARSAGLAESALIDAVTSEPLLSSVPEVVDRAGDGGYDEHGLVFRYRDDGPTASAAPLPAWGDPDLPLVYVTFGSVTGSLPPFAGVFRQALDGMVDLPVRVLMTVGRRFDIADIGPVPPSARIEAWWPQQDVLGRAALVLGHGGFGTTMGALRAGVPQVVAPIFTTDQVVNARHVGAAGAGRAVDPGPDVVTRACREVPAALADPAYRAGAESVADSIAAIPPAAHAITVLRRLVGGG